mmetsp:Transcript_18065/g.51389  ORF Transcript_18065/g.51389 Transcript_18065/m.51389 type:complete len:318 (-) Transcript_18065:349-1302(-)
MTPTTHSCDGGPAPSKRKCSASRPARPAPLVARRTVHGVVREGDATNETVPVGNGEAKGLSSAGVEPPCCPYGGIRRSPCASHACARASVSSQTSRKASCTQSAHCDGVCFSLRATRSARCSSNDASRKQSSPCTSARQASKRAQSASEAMSTAPAASQACSADPSRATWLSASITYALVSSNMYMIDNHLRIFNAHSLACAAPSRACRKAKATLSSSTEASPNHRSKHVAPMEDEFAAMSMLCNTPRAQSRRDGGAFNKNGSAKLGAQAATCLAISASSPAFASWPTASVWTCNKKRLVESSIRSGYTTDMFTAGA